MRPGVARYDRIFALVTLGPENRQFGRVRVAGALETMSRFLETNFCVSGVTKLLILRKDAAKNQRCFSRVRIYRQPIPTRDMEASFRSFRSSKIS